jgi:hypothetical protein
LHSGKAPFHGIDAAISDRLMVMVVSVTMAVTVVVIVIVIVILAA